MVLCFKRLYLLLFLLLSFGLQAQIKIDSISSFSSLFHPQKASNFYNVIYYSLNNKLVVFHLTNETKFVIIISFLTLLLLVTGLLFQTYKRLNAQRLLNSKQEEYNSQKMDSLLKEQELKLVKAWISGQEKERERISKELHDSIGKNLNSIKLQLNHLNNSNLKNITNINLQLEETYRLVRNLSNNLLPKKFSPDKFCVVLESYLVNLSTASGVEISFFTASKKEVNDMNELIQLEIFKIIQELLINTIKHAKASQIEIHLNMDEDVLNLLFEDNGLDFNSDKYIDGIDSIDLDTRINKLNGFYAIDNQLRRGTSIVMEIPSFTDAEYGKNNYKTVKGINLKNQLDALKSRF